MTCYLPAVHVAHARGQYFSPVVAKIIRSLSDGAADCVKLVPLSKREAEVVRLFASGMTVTEIATHLRRTKQTVSSQKSNAMKRVGVANDAALIKYALEVGLIPDAKTG